MSASAKQTAANRLNALLSTGPRTEAGKAISRLNSATHGLAGQLLVLRSADDEAYAAYYADMLPELAPGNMMEIDLARRIICDSWRLNRAAALDVNLLTTACTRTAVVCDEEDLVLAEARAFRANAPTFNTLSLYEQRLQRSFQKNLALLRALAKGTQRRGFKNPEAGQIRPALLASTR